jgi:hypothetical protein
MPRPCDVGDAPVRTEHIAQGPISQPMLSSFKKPMNCSHSEAVALIP